MKALGIVAAIALALALQTTLAHAFAANRAVVDFLLVVVVFAALSAGPVAGLLVGTVAGLAQDALAGGILGVEGLAKSLVGVAVGVLAQQFIVSGGLPRLVVFAVASAANILIVWGTYSLIDPGRVRLDVTTMVTESLLNALVGVIAFQVIEKAPGYLHRRRLRRASLRSR
ncbi:MAG: rod shape-determining protein MreD [Vicinamibacteraceae bacterium]|nr:rod shape-determining protein MreD [Vicinamibacteraceae bacterium]